VIAAQAQKLCGMDQETDGPECIARLRDEKRGSNQTTAPRPNPLLHLRAQFTDHESSLGSG